MNDAMNRLSHRFPRLPAGPVTLPRSERRLVTAKANDLDYRIPISRRAPLPRAAFPSHRQRTFLHLQRLPEFHASPTARSFRRSPRRPELPDSLQ